MRPEFEAAGYTIAGCSVDSPEFNTKFAEEHDFQYPLISNGGDVIKAFDSCKTPACTSARRVTVVVGSDGLMKHIDNTFDAKTGPDALLVTLIGAASNTQTTEDAAPRKKKKHLRSAHDIFHHSGEHRQVTTD